MAKNSRSYLKWAPIGAVALAILSPGAGMAEGLPLRSHGAVSDRALNVLGENLTFTLARLASSSPAWTAAVNEAVLIAARLGFPAEGPITAQRTPEAYVVLLPAEGFIAGADPDRVLGRLIYTMARAADPASRSASALTILDQPLSLTLAALTFPPPR